MKPLPMVAAQNGRVSLLPCDPGIITPQRPLPNTATSRHNTATQLLSRDPRERSPLT